MPKKSIIELNVCHFFFTIIHFCKCTSSISYCIFVKVSNVFFHSTFFLWMCAYDCTRACVRVCMTFLFDVQSKLQYFDSKWYIWSMCPWPTIYRMKLNRCDTNITQNQTISSIIRQKYDFKSSQATIKTKLTWLIQYFVAIGISCGSTWMFHTNQSIAWIVCRVRSSHYELP